MVCFPRYPMIFIYSWNRLFRIHNWQRFQNNRKRLDLDTILIECLGKLTLKHIKNFDFLFIFFLFKPTLFIFILYFSLSLFHSLSSSFIWINIQTCLFFMWHNPIAPTLFSYTKTTYTHFFKHFKNAHSHWMNANCYHVAVTYLQLNTHHTKIIQSHINIE